MKKVFIYSLVVAALLTAASCKKENAGVDYLTATISQYQGGKDAKVFLDENRVAYWNASGDVVNLNGVPSRVYPDGNYYKIAVNEQAQGNQYYAIFPNEYVTNATDHTVNLPTVQKYTETNGKQRINALMAAYGTTHLEFKNVCALLEVTVDGLEEDQHLTRIEVSTVGGTTPLAGSGTISFPNNGAPVLTMASGGSPTTVLQFDENGHHDGTYYIAVPPVRDQKFKIRIMFRQPSADNTTVTTYSKTYTQTGYCNLRASYFGSISTTDITSNPVDHLPGGFSTSTGVVYFSRGVVKCVNPTDNTVPSNVVWTFENNQYSATAYTSGGSQASQFDKSGFMPYSTANNHAGFPILSNSNSGAFWDWGGHYGGENSHWKTLSRADWTYLLSTRSASTVNGVANALYAYAKVNGQYGLILFPDIFSWPTPASNAPALISRSCINAANVAVDDAPNYDLDAWKELEDAGCVFLPALGYYDFSGNTGNFVTTSTNQGWYWTSDAVQGRHLAYCMNFPNVVSYPQESMGYGMLVRLVYKY